MKKIFNFILCAFLFALAIGFSACSKTNHEHVFSEWTIITAPSCLESGLQKRVCECGEEETQVLPATGHTEVTDPAVSATCTATGLTEGLHCSVCEAVLVGQTVTTKIPHAYEDGVCVYCGNYQSTIGLEFTLKTDDTYEVTGYTGTDPIIVIPPFYSDKQVTSIGENAFLDNFAIISVTLPNTLTEIGKDAFCRCVKLFEIYNKSSIEINFHSPSNGLISIYAKDIYTSSYTSKITTTENGFYLYNDEEEVFLVGYNGNETIITLPIEATAFPEYALASCDNITEVVIPDKFTYISEGMFFGCEELTKVTFGSNFTSIGEGAFYECKNLSDINVSQTKLTEVSAYSFSYCKSLLEITLPDTVTNIGEDAFKSCSRLMKIDLGNGLTKIGKTAFSESGLLSVTLPCSLTSIESVAFGDCDKLVEVYNKSSLNIEYGSESYGYAGYYAKEIYTGDNFISKVTTDADGFITYNDGTDVLLIGYTGTKSDITIPDYITIIYVKAFLDNLTVTSVVIPENVTYFGKYAFAGCSNLKNASFTNIPTIAIGAFKSTGLTEATIPEGRECIEGFMFYGCRQLKKVYVPLSITEIKSTALSYCDELRYIYYAGTLDQWYDIQLYTGFLTLTCSIVCTDGTIEQEGQTPNIGPIT